MNILLREYSDRLQAAADRWGGVVEGRIARWEAKLTRMSARLELERVGDVRYLIPRASVGCSAGLPNNLVHALVIVLETEEVFRRALSAEMELYGLRVWLESCPCDGCGGAGWAGCEVCGGRGVRT